MIITTEIAPSTVLSPFVRCYANSEFDTKGMDMKKPWQAAHEMTMVFFFKAKPISLVAVKTGQIVNTGNFCDVTGVAKRYMGIATFNGAYSFLEICFKPNGFNKIFGLPLTSITDHIITAEDVFDMPIRSLFEQLSETENLSERGHLVDAFLLQNLKKQKAVYGKDRITVISNMLVKSNAPIKVAQLASYANMSKRNFERHFLEQVGLSPKTFCCVTRFNHAFEIKLRYPYLDWTSIAHSCGYFDQMHLIKDFKRYSGNAPAAFLKQTPLTDQEYVSRIEA